MATINKDPQRELGDYIWDRSEHADIRVGSPPPLGTEEMGEGVHFALSSRNAIRVRLELFDHPEDPAPAQDLLELGTEARMNIPGTVEGHRPWRRRDDARTPEMACGLRTLTAVGGRLDNGGRHSPLLLPDDEPWEQSDKAQFNSRGKAGMK